MELFYRDELVTLYCGDARSVLLDIPGRFEAVITDPVWPGAPETIPGWEEGDHLMRVMSGLVRARARRLIVHLGSQCDPRWLVNVDASWPFLCVQHLEYAMPSFRGRTMLNDIAYAFGDYPERAKSPGAVVPGRTTCTRPREIKRQQHPSARAYEHVRFLVKWWATDGPVLDPFAGSGTTLLAAKSAGIPSIGIEREERFCALAVSRLRQRRMVFAEESA